jgi:hypothetical protein
MKSEYMHAEWDPVVFDEAMDKFRTMVCTFLTLHPLLTVVSRYFYAQYNKYDAQWRREASLMPTSAAARLPLSTHGAAAGGYGKLYWA